MEHKSLAQVHLQMSSNGALDHNTFVSSLTISGISKTVRQALAVICTLGDIFSPGYKMVALRHTVTQVLARPGIT